MRGKNVSAGGAGMAGNDLVAGYGGDVADPAAFGRVRYMVGSVALSVVTGCGFS